MPKGGSLTIFSAKMFTSCTPNLKHQRVDEFGVDISGLLRLRPEDAAVNVMGERDFFLKFGLGRSVVLPWKSL